MFVIMQSYYLLHSRGAIYKVNTTRRMQCIVGSLHGLYACDRWVVRYLLNHRAQQWFVYRDGQGPPIIDVLGCDGQNSFSPSPPTRSDSTPITQKESYIST